MKDVRSYEVVSIMLVNREKNIFSPASRVIASKKITFLGLIIKLLGLENS